MMIKKLFNPILTVLCILTMLTACADEAVVENTTQPMNGDVTICFDMTVPGLAKATRSAVASVDTIVESLHLFLFDHRGGFTKVVEATSVTNPTYDKEKTEYTSSSTSGFGTYTATIPGNTSIIHFVANYDYKEEGFDENASLGRSENAVMAPLTTSSHLYWGRYTYEQIKNGTTAVLYRNYAKVTAKVNLDTSSESTDQVTAIDILGWTLCYEPMKASVTPFNDNVPDNPDGTPGNLLDGTPYAFTLSTPFVTLPAPKAERQMTMTTPEAVAAVLAGKESASNPIHCLFEHTEEGYGHELFAIFKLKVTQQVTGGGTKTTTRYYKIKLLEDTKKEGNTVIERTPYDIIRNHEYIITFKGIEPEGGYGYTAEDGRNEQEAIRLAMIGLPANNSTVDIEMTIPEVQSADYVLRVEGSTIRYYKDITAENTTIDDIIVYFAPLNGETATSASDLTVSWENTTWESGTEGNIPALTLSATDQPNYYKISFTTNPFEEDENGNKHYKYGVIRITEKKEYLLSRFVQVFIGDPITFRPLLISSDIPSRTDERLTVVLKVPDLDYLPEELYPIQLTFGSSRVDVEKNLDVEQMKIDFDKADYNNVLQYLSKNSTSGVWSTTDNGDGTWAWTTAGKAVPNTWKYKYIYTLESPEDAGIHRITLRTVTDSIEDFKVLLEGKSLVTGTQVFNTRELEFKMQDEANGTDERRIMIDGAMEETRLTTAYLFKLDQTGADDITVNYTLGLYDEENRTAIPQTPSGDVILWVYYDHNQLTPPTDLTPKKDAENNWFVELTHDVSEKGAAGSITFTATDVVKDAVVFITARGTANYGDYNENYYTTDTSEDDPTLRTGYGNNDFLYTGVNDAALSYRSASAIINVLSTWSFNPATSTDGVEYKQESEVELPYGKDSLLYVRIEKPANTSGVILKLTSPTLQIQANDTYYTIKDATYGIIELKPTTGDFCYLKFLTTQYASAGELKLEAINEQTSYGNVSYKSSVPYDEATVTVTNKANTFAGFAYAKEDVLSSTQGTNYGTADADRTVRAVRGSRIGIRVFFPGSFQEQTKSFTFKMKSACYELHNDEAYKYSGAKTDIGDGSHIITVEDNGLTYDEAKDLCYLDLVLSATTWDNEETIRFLTDATTDATNYIRFYPYNVSIISDKQNYSITVEQSLDKSIWSTITDDSYTLTSASLATQGTSVYYLITLQAVGPYTEDKTFDFTIISDGLEVDNTNSSIAGVQKNDTIVFKGLEPSNETTNTYTLALKTSKALESGSNITATILSGETVKPDTLKSVLNNGGFLVKYQLGSETAEGVVAPESESVKADNPKIKIPRNFTLYKEGYTLTAWKDEEGTEYAIGTEVTVTKNMTLTPVFTENPVSLDDRKEAVTIHWDFQRQNGAPTVAWEGKTGLVWVAQASVTNGGTTETIDVKLDISPSGKLANGNWVDWAQINGGTTFTIPSQNKATVKVESYNDIYNANAAQHMTIAGDIIDQTSKTSTDTYEGTYTYEGIDKEIDIIFGNAGSYYRYVEVTLPEHNVIPTTDDVPFYIRRGILYDNGTESDYSSQAPHFEDDDHIDYMQNGDYALYKIYNTEESYYKVSFMAASNKNQISEGGDVSVTVSLLAENGTEYLTYGTVDIIEGDSWTVEDGREYSLTTNQPLPVGNYTLKITFNNTAGATTCNMNYIKLTKTDEVTTYEFTGVSKHTTTSELGDNGNNQDNEAVTSTDKQTMYVKQHTNTITLEVTATGGNNDIKPTIDSENYTLSSATYDNGVWTLTLNVKELVDEDITISCEGYSNNQTASIYVKPYVSASVDKTECYIGENVTVTVTATVIGTNKDIEFHIEDRGEGKYLTYETGSSTVTPDDNNKNQYVTISGLSEGTYTYTYTYIASAEAENNVIKVIPDGDTDYCKDNKFDASSSNFQVTVKALPTDVYEYYIESKVNFANGESGTHTEEEILERKTTHIYKNNVSQKNTIIDVLQLAAYYRYRNTGYPVTVETYSGSKILNNSEHMNQENQYIILNIPYPMFVNYKWVPRGDDRILNIYDEAGNIITTTHKDGNGNAVSNFVGNTLYDVINQRLDAGTYKLKSNNETELWYLKLSPYTP